MSIRVYALSKTKLESLTSKGGSALKLKLERNGLIVSCIEFTESIICYEAKRGSLAE